jgi:predicted transcriptional regulator
MPRTDRSKARTTMGRPAERTDTTSAFRTWLEARARAAKTSYADAVSSVAQELGRTRQHVYALANGNTLPSRKLAVAIEQLSGGKVDAVKSWG